MVYTERSGDEGILKYRDCFECRGACCRFFGISAEELKKAKEGIPVSVFGDVPDIERYLGLHRGVTVEGGKFFIDRAVEVMEYMDIILVKSVCKNLSDAGKCLEYETRPFICRDFGENKKGYLVPDGCMYG